MTDTIHANIPVVDDDSEINRNKSPDEDHHESSSDAGDVQEKSQNLSSSETKLIEALVQSCVLEDADSIKKILRNKLKKSQKDNINASRKGRTLTGKKIKHSPSNGSSPRSKVCVNEVGKLDNASATILDAPKVIPKNALEKEAPLFHSSSSLSKICEEGEVPHKKWSVIKENSLKSEEPQRKMERAVSFPILAPLAEAKILRSNVRRKTSINGTPSVEFVLETDEDDSTTPEFSVSEDKITLQKNSKDELLSHRKKLFQLDQRHNDPEAPPYRPPPIYQRGRSVSVSSIDLGMRKTRRSSVIEMKRKISSNYPPYPEGDEDEYPSPAGPSSNNHLERPIQVKPKANDFLTMCLSALYGKLLIVFGMALPMAEAITHSIGPIHYTVFLVYLYVGSIVFLIYTYVFMLRTNSFRFVSVFKKALKSIDWKKRSSGENDDEAYQLPKYSVSNEAAHHGSMYLKAGAVVFGIGSMVYSGLKFGETFNVNSECSDNFIAGSSLALMTFTFLQMYFIFLNSSIAFNKYTAIARFGLMHMLATNLCVWLNILIQETQHEIHALTEAAHESEDHEQLHESLSHSLEEDDSSISSEEDMLNHIIVRRSVSSVVLSSNCSRSILMKHALESAAPFLFPCAIEYSLLCAGVMYIMWKSISASKDSDDDSSEVSVFIARKARHLYSVDCGRASRGLFYGIFVLVGTIISIILFYILIDSDDYREKAMAEADIAEIIVYSLAIVAVLMGMYKMRELYVVTHGDSGLDNLLLLVAQTGVFVYSTFSLIADYFQEVSLIGNGGVHFVSVFLNFVQTFLQTLFILDGSRRCCYTPEQEQRKPGREIVTFLLICNLAMWSISTFETSRADAHPTQLEFYGIWTWSIISRMFMPLAIFYRFHVTVCLGSIWKSAYKLQKSHHLSNEL